MEQSLLEMLPNLGVGIAAVVVLFLAFRLFVEAINANSKVWSNQITEKDKAYISYVNDNNHKSVEVMTQCRDAIQASADNIREHTDAHRKLIEIILDRNSK